MDQNTNNTNTVQVQNSQDSVAIQFSIPDFSDLVKVTAKVGQKIPLDTEKVGFTLGCILAAAKARGVVITDNGIGEYGEIGWLASHPNSLGIRAKLSRSNNFRNLFKGSGLDINTDDVQYYVVRDIGFMILTISGQIILLDSPSNKEMNILYQGPMDSKALCTDLVQYFGVRNKMGGQVPGNYAWKQIRL